MKTELKPTKGTKWIVMNKAKVGCCRTNGTCVVFVDDGSECKAVHTGTYDNCHRFIMEHWEDWN